MQVKILFLGGNKEWLQGYAEPSTTVEVMERPFETPHLEYEFYEHIYVHRIIDQVVRAEKESFDAVVIPCFYDPGLRETRELVK
ncbi:hydantoin racemase, partial [Candidatus Bathyarchaeota archaeon]|nr:hydantoin racemase [Candidatus Bathyarchaeota archaeon]